MFETAGKEKEHEISPSVGILSMIHPLSSESQAQGLIKDFAVATNSSFTVDTGPKLYRMKTDFEVQDFSRKYPVVEQTSTHDSSLNVSSFNKYCPELISSPVLILSSFEEKKVTCDNCTFEKAKTKQSKTNKPKNKKKKSKRTKEKTKQQKHNSLMKISQKCCLSAEKGATDFDEKDRKVNIYCI